MTTEEEIETVDAPTEEVIEPTEEVIDAPQTPEDAPQDDDGPEGVPTSPDVPEDDHGARKARREAQGLRQRLRDAEDATTATTTQLDQLRAALAERDAADAARILDNARTRAAADQRIPAGLVQFITGGTPDEIAASAIGMANELRWLTEVPLLGIDPGPLRTRTLDAHHAANTRSAAEHDRQHGAGADLMAQAIRGR